MKDFAFEGYIPSFKSTLWLAVLVAVIFGLSWWIVHEHAISPDDTPKVTCQVSWKQDDEARKWRGDASCPFGDVEVAVDSTAEKAMYWMSVKGRPVTLQCWKITYPSGYDTGCKLPY